EAANRAGYTQIGWHCWEHNIGSRKVGEKVGFKLMHPYPAYVCMNDDAWYTMELGVMAARGGNHREALALYEAAPDLGWAYFLAARSHLALNEPEAALMKLNQALDHGWNIPDALLGDEFKPLHELSGWQALLADPRLKPNVED
ncbi:MAG: hypothetical protein H7X77_07435, partial [Anaerolineae bacterium]|nr:hypothetical protein [Anaerolineae bacterium]